MTGVILAFWSSSQLRNLPPADRRRIWRAAERDGGSVLAYPWAGWIGIPVAAGWCGGAVLSFDPDAHDLAWIVMLLVGGAVTVGWYKVRHAITYEHVRRRLAWEGRCPACGYDRQGTPVRCPECGTTDQI